MMAWKRVSAAVFAVVLGLAFAACAPQERMDAYVRQAHPRAWTIDRLNTGLNPGLNTSRDDIVQVYILCEDGAVRVVVTDRSFGSANFREDVELIKSRVSCK